VILNMLDIPLKNIINIGIYVLLI